MNKVEVLKAEKDGLDSLWDIYRFAERGGGSMTESDAQRMKWYGVFQRNPTPGFFMIRVRMTNGLSNAEQFRVLADLADETGRGFVHLTTRQQVQLRWVAIERVPEIFARLKSVGLHAMQTGMDNVRNICGCPAAGLTPQELFDAAPVAQALANTYLGNPLYSNLPRKFNVSITGCLENCTHAETQDLALVPALSPDSSRTPGFNVLVGGKNGSGGYRPASPLNVFVTPDEAVGVCLAILALYRDFGHREQRNRARLSFLLDEWGTERFRLKVEERVGRKLAGEGEDRRSTRRHVDHVGVLRQKHAGLNYVGLTVPVGKMTTAQLREAAHLSEAYGDGEIRLTSNQNLILPHVPDAKLGSLLEEPFVKEFPYAPTEIMRGLVACTGTDFCNLAVIEVKDIAIQTARALEARLPSTQPLTMHWSGCPAGCGNHQQADIGFLGKKIKINGTVQDGVDIFVGGRSGPGATRPLRVIEDIPVGEVEDFLVSMVKYHPREKLVEALRKRGREVSLDGNPTNRSSGSVNPPSAASIATLRQDDIPSSGAAVTSLGGKPVAVLRNAGRLCAFSNVCPHENAPLDEGVVDGDEIICPLHAYRFSLTTGACSTVPGLSLEIYDAAESASGEITVRERSAEPSGTPAPPALTTWSCRSCRFEQKGERPPTICPVCASGTDQFYAGTEPAKAATRDRSGKRVVIVGGSIAAHVAAQTCRQVDPEAHVQIITDEAVSFYNRLGLTRWMSDEIQETHLFDYSPDWYVTQGIEVVTRSRAVALDPVLRRLMLSTGQEIGFDVLILAHGSGALTPPFYRGATPGAYLLRTLEDVRGILAAASEATRAAVIGGGVLGLEAAHGLLKRGARVSVFEYAAHLMPRQLDAEAAGLLAAYISSKGTHVHVGAGVAALESSGTSYLIRTTDGREFEADLVVVSTGIKPNIDWVSASGIRCERGIQVDDRMKTSSDSVYAAGDVTEWRGQVVGLWANAIEQARVAAANAMGQEKRFSGFIPATILKCWDYPVFSIGEIAPIPAPSAAVPGASGSNGTESKTFLDPVKKVYRRIDYRHGLPIGAILVGTREGTAELKKLVEWRLQIQSIETKLFGDHAAEA
ncbi:MAG: FAD-dependent oxidoreductase [Nitrospirae bacterium]|nr:FAD-dependent oxidoreductase [Nitrospirota bacterium]